MEGKIDLDLTGFDEVSLDDILTATEPEAAEVDAEPQIDKAEELQAKWKTELGQVWELGDHRLFCGDCLDFKIEKQVALLLTDPPYGIGATPFVQPVGGTEAGEEPRSPEKKSLRELYRHDDVRRLFAALLLLAAQKLRSGGRLVFFCPEPFLSEFDDEGGASDHRGGLFLGLPLPEPLVLLHAQRQIFRGGTFSRLLVVVEKA